MRREDAARQRHSHSRGLTTTDRHPMITTLCAAHADGWAPPPDAPAAGRAVWIDPAGLRAPPGLERGVRFHGPVAGAWGGSCFGEGRVSAGTMAFHAELRLDAGDAVNAALRGGGHGLDWVCAVDPTAPVGSPVVIGLHLWLSAELRSMPRPPRGWGTDPGGGAFVGSEDNLRRPLSLRLPLQPQQPGPQLARGSHAIELPNRCWTLLPSRFATRIHSSGEQWLHWIVSASVRLEPAAAGVRLHLAAAGANAALPAA